ncbi:MAG: HWE histidine kinase domain-containing protein [Erythrobacter sp.]
MYGATIVLTVGVVLIRRWLDLFGSGIVPFALFYPVILVCTLLGGIRAGVLSLLIASAAASYLWIKPQGDFGITGSGAISFALFLLSNAVNILVAHHLRKTQYRLRRSEARLNLSQTVGRIGIWDLNLRTGEVWWSPTFRELTGIGPEREPSIEAFMARIVEADRERATRCFEDARRGLNRLNIDFRFNRDDGTTIWLAGRAELFRDAQGRPTRLLGINFDATPIRTVEEERDQANALLKTFFDSLPGAAFAKDLEGRYLLGNPIFATAIGHAQENFLGRTDLELLIDKDQARAIMANDRAIIVGGETRQIEEPLLLPNGEMSYWLAVKAPFFDAVGEPQGLMGISLDVTDRRKAEERLRFLADEVDHRAKNLLGVVLSLVRLTKVDDVAAFKTAVSGRIEALARAHTLLAANRWQGVNIATLLREEIAPFGRPGSDRINLTGPPLLLEPNAAQALAMAMHELAINAAMHGALSAEEGQLAVDWEVSEEAEDSQLVLNWRETGGPAVATPARAGFGSTAMRGAIEHQLGGVFALDWAPTGLAARISFPLAGNARDDRATLAAESRQAEPRPAAEPAATLEGKRVLILEDEALLALTLMDTLRELGCTVVGPASTVPAALDLVRQNPPDLAILDVNLAGTGSAPVAAALRERNIPFVYCTGYAEPALQIAPDLFAPMLTKPIDPRGLGEALCGAGVPPAASPAPGPEPIGA